METVYLVRCINCKRRNFTEEYERGQLVCSNCGLVGHTESVSDSAIDEFAEQLLATSITPEETLSPVILELLDEYKQEQLDRPLEEQLQVFLLEDHVVDRGGE